MEDKKIVKLLFARAENAINEGHMGFKIYPYEANGSVYYSVELVNL